MSAVAFRHLRGSSVPCRAIQVTHTCKSGGFRRLTVRMCFLRMYKKKLHNLEVTPRKVRTPSRHWRVFSMSAIPPESVRGDLTLHRRPEQHDTPVEITPCRHPPPCSALAGFKSTHGGRESACVKYHLSTVFLYREVTLR